jgi:3-hydroxyisobutyrate dehydrogenase-like beta-hydroxyacid dehydrogenase
MKESVDVDGVIGFIGVGAMGGRMARNVIEQGCDLWAYDVRAEALDLIVGAGAHAADSPRHVAQLCDWIILSLPDGESVNQVLHGDGGMSPALRRGQIIIDCGTTDPTQTCELAEEQAARGVFWLDAPVSGLDARAEDGTLTIMVGGDECAYEKVLPLLHTIGELVVHMGAAGNGQLMKMTNNVLFNISCAALAEMLPFATRLGLDPEKVRAVVGTSSGQSFGFDFFSERILKGDFETGYKMRLAYKDMDNIMARANERRVPLPVASAAMQTYQMALAQGHGDESKAAMVKVWERVMGAEVKKQP